MSAAKLTAAAEKTAGHAKIAARLAARSEARDLATRFKNVRGRLLETARTEYERSTGILTVDVDEEADVVYETYAAAG